MKNFKGKAFNCSNNDFMVEDKDMVFGLPIMIMAHYYRFACKISGEILILIA